MTGHLASGTDALLSVVQSEIESNIAAHGHARTPKPDAWRRPFLDTASAIREPFREIVKEFTEFPTKDESVGKIMLGFRGPHPLAFLERIALNMLATYLTSSSAAPLNKEYVDIEKPMWYVRNSDICCLGLTIPRSTHISINTSSVYATAIDLVVNIGAVPTEHLEKFDERLRASFARIADEGLDMTRMATLLVLDERQVCLRWQRCCMPTS